MVYASLLPFDFRGLPRVDDFRALMEQVRVRSTTPEDARTNLLVYIPIGLLYARVLARCGAGRLGAVAGATLCGAGLSLLMECLQTALASRVSSWTDVWLNGLGTLIGAAGLGLGRFLCAGQAQLRRELGVSPWTSLGSLLMVGLFAYGLAPFDFVTDTAGLHTAFGRALWAPVGPRIWSQEGSAFGPLMEQLSGAAWFAVLGALLGLAALEHELSPVRAFAKAVRNAVGLAALIELMQLFTQSHVFDAATILLRGYAAALGAWMGVFIMAQGGSQGCRAAPSLHMPRPIVGGLIVMQLALLAGACLPWGRAGSAEGGVALAWPPLAGLWRQPAQTAGMWLVSVGVTYATLAATVWLVMDRSNTRYAQVTAAGVTVATALAVELLRSVAMGSTADPAVAVVAFAASLLALQVVSTTAKPPTRACRRVTQTIG